MYHVYTEKKDSSFSRTHIGDFKDYDDAMDRADEAIENKPELIYIVEETDGHVNNYGDLIVTEVARGGE